jgi:hypothetical protein
MKPIESYKTGEELLELANKINIARIYLSLIHAHHEGLIKDTIFLFKDETHETLFDKLKYDLQDNVDFTFTEDDLDNEMIHTFYNQAVIYLKSRMGL